jgi:hypothetical protein
MSEVRANWNRLRATFDEQGLWPAILTLHTEASWSSSPFSSLEAALRQQLNAAPWLEELGYGWTLERGAYDFSQEALNQVRVLSALAGFGADARAGVSARLTTGWSALESPRALPGKVWSFVQVPFSWDNFATTLFGGVLAYGLEQGSLPPRFTPHDGLPDWRDAAAGLVVQASLPSEAQIASPGIAEWLARNVDCLRGASRGFLDIPSQQACCLWCLSCDFLIAHETAHLLYHNGGSARTDEADEHDADMRAFDAIRRWSGSRDVNAICAGLHRDAPVFDLFSAYCFFSVLLALPTASARLTIVERHARLEFLRRRLASFFEALHPRIGGQDPMSAISDADSAEGHQLLVTVFGFLQEVARLRDKARGQITQMEATIADEVATVMQELEEAAAGARSRAFVNHSQGDASDRTTLAVPAVRQF